MGYGKFEMVNAKARAIPIGISFAFSFGAGHCLRKHGAQLIGFVLKVS